VIATTKFSIFEIVLSASGTPSEGYEKVNEAQIGNTKDIAAKENGVYLDSFISARVPSSYFFVYGYARPPNN